MKYAKIINENLLYIAPPKITSAEGKWLENPTDNDYINAGFLPFVDSAEPEVPEGYHLEEVLTATGKEVKRTYKVVENELSEEEIKLTTIMAQLEYIAMMTDVDLEEV